MKLFNTDKAALILIDRDDGKILEKSWLIRDGDVITEVPMIEDDNFAWNLLRGGDPEFESLPVIKSVKHEESVYLMRDGERMDGFDYSVGKMFDIKRLIMNHVDRYNEIALPAFHPDIPSDIDVDQQKDKVPYNYIISKIGEKWGKWDMTFSNKVAKKVMDESDIRIGLYTTHGETLSSGETLEKGTYISLYNKDKLILREHFDETWVDNSVSEFMDNIEALDALYRVPQDSMPIIIYDVRNGEFEAINYLCYARIGPDPKIEPICSLNEDVIAMIKEERDGIGIKIGKGWGQYTVDFSLLIKGIDVPYSVKDGDDLKKMINEPLFDVLTDCIERSEKRDPTLARLLGTEEQREKQLLIGRLDIFEREQDYAKSIARDN